MGFDPEFARLRSASSGRLETRVTQDHSSHFGGTMTVAYDEAIATLKAMFENTDDQMIKTVLEANGGPVNHHVQS